MIKKLCLIALVTTFMFGDCNKKTNPPVTSTPNFQPSKAGSVWNYRNTNLLTSASFNYTLAATSKDTVVNGRTYKVFTNTSGSNEYYAASGTDYYQFGKFEAIAQNVDLLYLKSALAAGGTWEENKTITVSGVAVSVKFTYTLAEKDISYTVGSNTFTKVSRVNIVLSATGLAITSQNINFYYADGIGRIFSKAKLVVPIAGINSDTETGLLSYTLAP